MAHDVGLPLYLCQPFQIKNVTGAQRAEVYAAINNLTVNNALQLHPNTCRKATENSLSIGRLLRRISGLAVGIARARSCRRWAPTRCRGGRRRVRRARPCPSAPDQCSAALY